MFDYVAGEVKCQNCHKEFIAEEQIKWADCTLQCYNVGDSIHAEDGEYDYATLVRPTLDTQCHYCKTWQHFKAIVKNGVLEKLKITKIFTMGEQNEE